MHPLDVDHDRLVRVRDRVAAIPGHLTVDTLHLSMESKPTAVAILLVPPKGGHP